MDDMLSAALAAHQIAPDAILALPAESATPAIITSALQSWTQAVVLHAGASPVDWALWPILFDLGFVPVNSEPGIDVFVRSSHVLDVTRIGGRSRGRVTMTTLGHNGRFANQIFQHAYVTLYGLRLGCSIELPAWEGTEIYGQTANPAAEPLPSELRYQAFDCDDLALWEMHAPPLTVDFWGYFQELPACWTPHRELLRRLYHLGQTHAEAIRQRLERLRGAPNRPFVAIHVRRGDYVTLHKDGLPWYRPAPEAWYVAWLDEVFASHPDAVLYVATDSPDSILPAFSRFNPRSLADVGAVARLSPALVDFEMMRRADYLAVCNSSFSRMAAILAPEGQSAAIVDFETERLQPFNAWSNELFWARFEGRGLPKRSPALGYDDEARRQRWIDLKKQAAVGLKSYNELGSLWATYSELSERMIEIQRELDRSTLALQSSVDTNLRLERHNESLELSLRAALLRQPHRLGHRIVFRSLFFAARAMRRLLGPNSGLTRVHLDPMIHALAQFRHREAAGLAREAARSVLERLRLLKRVRRLPAALAAAGANLAGRSAIHESGKSVLAAATSRLAVVAADDADIAVQIEQSSAAILALSPEPPSLSLSIAQAVLSAEPDLDAMVLGEASARPSLVVKREALLPAPNSRKRLMRGLDIQEWAERLASSLPKLRSWRPQTFSGTENGIPPPQWPIWPTTESAVDAGQRLEAALLAVPGVAAADGRPHCLVVVPWLPVGGSEVVLLDVLGRLAADWRLTVVTTLPAIHGMHEAFSKVVDEIVHLGELLDDERMTAVIAALLRANSSRVLLTSNSTLAYASAPALKARMPEVAFVSILHNDLKEGHIRHATRYAVAFHSHVAISAKIGNALMARGVRPDAIRVIPNGVDTTLFSPSRDRAAARSHFDAGADDILLGFVGRLSGEKRPQKFLDIISSLKPCRCVKALMIGTGSELAALKVRIAQEGLPVVILPKVERNQMPDVYSALDALVMTSSIEGMPMVLLEALACGTPVATTLVGDVDRLITAGENGFLAPVDDVQILANQLSAAIGEGRLAGMRADARDSLMRSGMTQQQMLDGYTALMRETLDRAPLGDPTRS